MPQVSTMMAGLVLCAFIINACDTKDSVEPYQGQVFIKLFGGRGSEEGKDLLQLPEPDGGFVMVGSTTSPFISSEYTANDSIETMGGKDIYVVRTDEKGNVKWEKKFGGSGDDVGNSVILVGDVIYVCGHVTRNGSNVDVQVLEISLDNKGEVKYESYGDPLRNEYGKSILDIENDGFLITSTWVTPDTSAFFMVETDDNLKALSNKEDYIYGTYKVNNLSTTSFELAKSNPTDSASFVCFGSVKEFNTGKYHFQSFMYPQSNSPNRYGSGEYDEWCTDAYELESGGFILAGYRDDGIYKKEYVVKIDANRNEIWKHDYPNIFNKSIGESCGIIQTQDGGYLVSSKIELDDKEGNDEISLLKLNAIGGLEWRQTFGSDDNDVASRVVQLEDGSYVVVGTIGFDINPDSQTKMCLIKVNVNGELVPIN